LISSEIKGFCFFGSSIFRRFALETQSQQNAFHKVEAAFHTVPFQHPWGGQHRTALRATINAFLPLTGRRARDASAHVFS
jgi:hypothetical protein